MSCLTCCAARPGGNTLVCRLLEVLLCCSLAGCSASLFQSKAAAPTVYVLSARLPAGQGPRLPLDLVIPRPRVRSGLDSDRIVVLYPDRRLDYFAAARWNGPLDAMMQDLAVEAFRTNARLHAVSTDASAFSSNYWLELDVEDCEAVYPQAGGAPIIRVHLVARLGAAAERRVMGSVDVRVEQPASDNRLTAIVAAFERAADDALGQIVAGTTQTLDALPGSPVAMPPSARQSSANPVASVSR